MNDIFVTLGHNNLENKHEKIEKELHGTPIPSNS